MSTDVLEVKASKDTALVSHAFVAGLGNFVNTFAIVGPSDTNARNVIISGLSLSTPTPATVLIQPRQSESLDHGYPDVFAAQVVETATDHITVHIKRLDAPTGWGQFLRVDILIVERMNS